MEKSMMRLLPNGATDFKQVSKDGICNEFCSEEYDSKVLSQKRLDKQFKNMCFQSNDDNEPMEENLNGQENFEVHRTAPSLESASLTSRFIQTSNVDKLNLTTDLPMQNLQSELQHETPKRQISKIYNKKRNLLTSNEGDSTNYSSVNFTSKKSYLNYIGVFSSFLKRVWPSSKSNDTAQSSNGNVNKTVVADELEFMDSVDSTGRSSNNPNPSSERVAANSSVITNMHIERTLYHYPPDSFPSTSKKPDDKYKQVSPFETNNPKNLTCANIFEQHSGNTIFRDIQSALDSSLVERPTKDHEDNVSGSNYSETLPVRKLHLLNDTRETFQPDHSRNGSFWHNTGLPDCKWFQDMKLRNVIKDIHFQYEETNENFQNKCNQMEHFTIDSVPEFGPKKFQKQYNGLKRSTNLKAIIEELHQSFKKDFVYNNTEQKHALSKDNIASFRPVKSPRISATAFEESKQPVQEFTEKFLGNNKSSEIQNMFDICSDSDNTADNMGSKNILKAPRKGKKCKRRKKFSVYRKRQVLKSEKKIEETKSSVAPASKYLEISRPTILNRPRRGLRNAKEVSVLTNETTDFQEYCNSIQSKKDSDGLSITNNTSDEQLKVIKLCSPTEITVPENFIKTSKSLIVQKGQRCHGTSFQTNHHLSLQLKTDSVKRVFEVLNPKCKSEQFLHSKITAKFLTSNSCINQSAVSKTKAEIICPSLILAKRPILERKAKIKALALLSNKMHVTPPET